MTAPINRLMILLAMTAAGCMSVGEEQFTLSSQEIKDLIHPLRCQGAPNDNADFHVTNVCVISYSSAICRPLKAKEFEARRAVCTWSWKQGYISDRARPWHRDQAFLYRDINSDRWEVDESRS